MVYSVKFKAFVLIGFVLVCLTACGPLDVKRWTLNPKSGPLTVLNALRA